MTIQKAIGPTFSAELNSADLAGLPFAWSSAGTFSFSSAMTSAQIAAVEAVYAAHDPSKQDFTATAQAALDKSDITALRCFENAVPLPAAWTAYRVALRAIVKGSSVSSLPVDPAYPAGT